MQISNTGLKLADNILIKTVKNLIDDFSQGNWESGFKYLTDDFQVFEPLSLPFGGIYHGSKGYMDLINKVSKYWDKTYDARVLRYYADHDSVITYAELTLQSMRTDKILEITAVEHWVFYNGKIRNLAIYYSDTKLLFDYIDEVKNIN